MVKFIKDYTLWLNIFRMQWWFILIDKNVFLNLNFIQYFPGFSFLDYLIFQFCLPETKDLSNLDIVTSRGQGQGFMYRGIVGWGSSLYKGMGGWDQKGYCTLRSKASRANGHMRQTCGQTYIHTQVKILPSHN